MEDTILVRKDHGFYLVNFRDSDICLMDTFEQALRAAFGISRVLMEMENPGQVRVGSSCTEEFIAWQSDRTIASTLPVFSEDFLLPLAESSQSGAQ